MHLQGRRVGRSGRQGRAVQDRRRCPHTSLCPWGHMCYGSCLGQPRSEEGDKGPRHSLCPPRFSHLPPPGGQQLKDGTRVPRRWQWAGPASLKTCRPAPSPEQPGRQAPFPGLRERTRLREQQPLPQCARLQPDAGCGEGWCSVQDGLEICGQGRVSRCLQNSQGHLGELLAQPGLGCKENKV